MLGCSQSVGPWSVISWSVVGGRWSVGQLSVFFVPLWFSFPCLGGELDPPLTSASPVDLISDGA